jgi:membrane-associated protease RseP (regulator of RpoE activity)
MGDLAGNGDHGTFTPTQLFAGDKDFVTEPATFKSGEGAFVQYEVASLEVATNKIVKLDATVVDGTEVPGYVVMQPVDSTAADKQGPVAIEGFFNHAALVWPAGTALDTFAERHALLAKSYANPGVRVGTLG